MPEEVPVCDICDSGPGCPDQEASQRLCLLPPFKVVRCSFCGAARLSPRPTSEEYAILYEDNYFGLDGSCPRWLRDYPVPDDSYEEGALWERQPVWHERLRRLQRLQALGPILDVGASTGEFLVMARNDGWQVEGIELSQAARDLAKTKHGLSLSSLPLDKFCSTSDNDTYAVIHMSHVVEHLPYPKKSLLDIMRILKPGGILVAEVPNQFRAWVPNVYQKISGGTRSRSVYSLHHTYFLSRPSMYKLFKEVGMAEVTVGTHDPAMYSRGNIRRRLVRRAINYLADRAAGAGENITAYGVRP